MLGDNKFDDEGVVMFCDFLKSKECALKEFSIGSNFGDHGALAIAKALNFNKDIEAFYINNNNMTDLGASVLAEVVSRHTTCDNVQVSSKTVKSSNIEQRINQMTQTELKKAFEVAVANDEQGPWMRSKIMVVGQGRAGKTASVRSMLGETYIPDLDSTIGASISQSNTKAGGQGAAWQDKKDSKVDFTVDTAARLAALKLARQRNEDQQKLEKFSIEDTIKYYEAKGKEQKFATTSEAKKKINQVMTEEEINKKFDTQLVTRKHNGKDDIAFTIWDYGGQTVFYTLHHLFLTKYGIYLLVFDMREILCKGKGVIEKAEKRAQTRDYLLFWLNSVSMHAPDAPLMIIGTFLDALESKSELETVNRILHRILSDRHKKQIHNNGRLLFFPLNNRRPETDYTELFTSLGANFGRNIEVVRDQIEVIARSQEFVNQELSLRWVKTLDTMLEQPDNFLELQRVYELAQGVGLNDSLEVDKMLAFFHELGMIVHLTSTSNLRQIVTVKPQWLIDSLSQIIRDEKLHKFNMAEVTKNGLKGQHDLLMEKHVATIDWFEYVWLKKKVDFLVDLMRRTLLISDWKFGEYRHDTAFLVPSLINEYNSKHADIADKMLIQFTSPNEDRLLLPAELSDYKPVARGKQKNHRKIPGFGRMNLKKLVPILNQEEEEKQVDYEGEREELLENNDVNKFYAGPTPEDFFKEEDEEEELIDEKGDVNEENNGKSKRNKREKKKKKDLEGEIELKAKKKGKKKKGKPYKDLSHEEKAFLVGQIKTPYKMMYGFADRVGIRAAIFDFTQSFLPAGVFQRLLCLCILKSTSSDKDISRIPEPQLYTNSAVIWISPKQKLTLIKENYQILCLIEKEHYKSYKMLSCKS